MCSSPSLWAATAASYCPSRAVELPKQNMTRSQERWVGKLCMLGPNGEDGFPSGDYIHLFPLFPSLLCCEGPDFGCARGGDSRPQRLPHLRLRPRGAEATSGQVVQVVRFTWLARILSIFVFESGTNCIKKSLPGKLILSNRKGLREVIFS